MKIHVVAVGTKMSDWVQQGIAEYAKRLPQDFALNMTEVALSQRTKSSNLGRAIDKEGSAMLKHVRKSDYVVALDVKGKSMATETLAQRISGLGDRGLNIVFLIGGPDGLALSCLQRANEKWSLSALTLPHPIVRVVLVEQLYRAWSILNNHPYHRAS